MFSKIFALIFVGSYLIFFPWEKFLKKSQLFRGKKLLLSVYHLEEESFCGRISSLPEKNPYKFFSGLLDSFLLHFRQFGIPIFTFLGDFKVHLSKDLLMEEKLLKEFKEGIYQFLFIGVISFGFWWWSHYFLDIKIIFSDLFFFALFLEVLGLIVFLYFFPIMRKFFLKDFESLFKSYYLFWGLSSIGLPVVEVLNSSQILEPKTLNFAHKGLHFRARIVVENWKEKGFPVKEAFDGLIEELWALYNIRFQAFRRAIRIMNFFIMALFYLGSFFILLLDFINLFFIELK